MTPPSAGTPPPSQRTSIRTLRHDDLDALLPLQRQGAVNSLDHLFPQDSHPFPTDDIRAQWAAEIADVDIDCFAAIRTGDIVGFFATKGNELLHFGTAVQTWGTGVAGELHQLIVEHLRDQGFSTSWLKVLQGNTRAIAFYTRRGWHDTGITDRSAFPPYPALAHLQLDLAREDGQCVKTVAPPIR